MSTDRPSLPDAYDTDLSREPEGACPDSAVADAIVHWDEVREGDLVLHFGLLEQVERVDLLDQGDGRRRTVSIRLKGRRISLTFWCDEYAAVRRYVTGESQ